MICHYWFFNQGFNFQDYLCNGFHDLTMLSVNISDIAINTVKDVDYCCIIHKISKSEAMSSKILFSNIVGVYKKILSVFFNYFCLVYIKWLILWTSTSL